MLGHDRFFGQSFVHHRGSCLDQKLSYEDYKTFLVQPSSLFRYRSICNSSNLKVGTFI